MYISIGFYLANADLRVRIAEGFLQRFPEVYTGGSLDVEEARNQTTRERPRGTPSDVHIGPIAIAIDAHLGVLYGRLDLDRPLLEMCDGLEPTSAFPSACINLEWVVSENLQQWIPGLLNKQSNPKIVMTVEGRNFRALFARKFLRHNAMVRGRRCF